MKNMNYLTKFLAGAIAITTVALATVASAQTTTKEAAEVNTQPTALETAHAAQLVTVVKVEGQARFSTDNKTWHKLKQGEVLKPGSVIQTAENSTVDIMMGERVTAGHAAPISINGINTLNPPPAINGGDTGPKANLVRIYPSSVLAIDKLVVEKTGVDEVVETQLDLRAGQILGNVKKLSAASRYEVKIPNGVAGIRGTVYMVTATGVVYVLEGQVIISYVNAQGQLVTATVSAGNNFNPFQGPNGTTTPTPPATNAALLAAVNQLDNNANVPGTVVTKGPNNTVITISDN